jgi:raffinose synthase
LWFGEFMQPDWDMFQSAHAWGAFHAAARALSGGPVYVSDKPGEHDFALLRKLVCSDGSVPRCDEPGRPTLDVLLCDPTREDVAFKIYNRSGPAGVVGAFNARVASATSPAPTLRAELGPGDVPDLRGERFASYFHVSGRLEVLAPGERCEFLLEERRFELGTFAPIAGGFAAIGLVDKFNSAATVRATGSSVDQHELAVCDGGTFLAYSERAPKAVELDDRPHDFVYEAASGALSLTLPGPARLRIRFA